MDQNREDTVDLLEIYHARQVRDVIISQLQRLRGPADYLPEPDRMRRLEVRGYYEALLLTVAELQHHMGDEEISF